MAEQKKRKYSTVEDVLKILKHLPHNEILLIGVKPLNIKSVSQETLEKVINELEEERIQSLTREILEGVIEATKHGPGSWPWSSVNATSGKEYLDEDDENFEETKIETDKFDKDLIGMSREEIIQIASEISNIKTTSYPDEEYVERTLNYKCGVHLIQVVNSSRGDDPFYTSISVDGTDCSIPIKDCSIQTGKNRKTTKYTLMKNWPKCTLLAVLWILGVYRAKGE